MKTINEKLNNTFYGAKSLAFKMEDIDLGNRIVKGYLSAFNIKDSDGDVIRNGAFTKSLNDKGVNSGSNRTIQYLRHHDWEQQIGKFLELEQDEYGLKFVGKLGTSSKGEDALRDYDEGIIKEHSIGFNYVKGKIDKKEDSEFGEYYEIKEVALWEGSAVTFGANEFTPVLDVSKGQVDANYLEKLNSEMTILIKALRNGRGTDERLENIELRLKQIQQSYNSLFELKAFDKNTLEQEPKKEDVQKVLKDLQTEKLRKMLLKNV